MYIVSWWDHFLGFLFHKLGLSLVFVFSTVSFLTSTSEDLTKTWNIPAVEIKFSDFSPAFAAFEDEFLWSGEEEQEATLLVAGQSTVEKVIETLEIKKTPVIVQDLASSETGWNDQYTENPKPQPQPRSLLAAFDGQVQWPAQELARPQAVPQKIIAQKETSVPSKIKIDQQELQWGALATLINKKSSNVSPVWGGQVLAAGNSPGTENSESTPKEQDQKEDFKEKAIPSKITDDLLASRGLEPLSLSAHEKVNKPSVYKVRGNLELKEGLAFVGSMSVSWVVSDYELAMGNINIKDATFEIETTELVGEIIISLYDQYNEMIGEGRLDLSQYPISKEKILAQITVLPIDLNTAGKVVEVATLGSPKMKMVSGADVDLYAFNNRAETNKQGEFSFKGWKKSNSRTLAIASKKGYRDSVFLIDSKKPSTVILFDNRYVDAFFDYLSDIGLRDKQDKGTVYGTIVGVADPSGYRVSLEKNKALYFIEAGFPTESLNQTSTNGLFAFVGLQDGDYILRIEKEGEIIDEKVVIVEQGKISPVYADLTAMKKHLAFYDPFDPGKLINDVELRFFDGYQVIQRNQQNTHEITVRGGNDAGILDYYEDEKASRTFISRQRSVQKIPLLRDKALMKLADIKNLNVGDGLIFGFIESPEKYRIQMVEEAAEKIVYFNSQAQEIDPSKEIAFGFMMGGFTTGLKTLVIESLEDPMILATDLVFSDHDIISLINTQILLAP